jgi:hypothetical protein
MAKSMRKPSDDKEWHIAALLALAWTLALVGMLIHWLSS